MDALLAPYLTPEQALLLRYEGTLPPALLAALGARLRDELAALRTLVPEPLAQDPAGLRRRADRLWAGSLLCADLSGFTALTEELAAHGRRGTEELCAIINRVFGALLDELQAYGGVVLKFGGDGLTGFFADATPGQNHSLAACAAALAMQRRMAEFAALSAGGQRHRLRLRISVHRGSPFCAIVGDPERRELVVTGRAVNRVALLQEQAAPGQVMISGETLASLDAARTTPRLSGHVLHDLPPVDSRPTPALPPLPAGDDLATIAALAAQIAELSPFLPTQLPRHVLRPETPAGGEFRQISALFINVTSLSGVLSLLETTGQPAAQVLAAYYDNIQRVMRRYGGEINKFDINSVGDKLLAIFGAPVAYEDDPLRAVEAALDLEPALQQANQELRQIIDAQLRRADEADPIAGAALWRTVDLSLRQRVGVASGNVFAGAVGSPQRREYTVIGQVVNLAARLMAAAEPGTVIVAPATARAVEAAVRLDPLPPLMLKGFGQPIAAAVVLGRIAEPPAPATPAAPLVGRADELALLRDHAAAALAGAGRAIAISGEAGIGKSRLSGAFWQELADQPVRRVALSGRANAQNSPYAVVRALLGALFDLPEAAAPHTLWPAIERMVAGSAPEFVALTPLLDSVFGSEPPAGAGAPARPPRSPLARLPQAEQRERLHDLIIALVAGDMHQRPLAILIDDLHWADASSLAVVQQLCQLADTLPLLIVLSYRPTLLAAAPWLALPPIHAIRLEGLDRESSCTMLAQLLDGQLAAGLDLILERAQGSPLFLEALVRHLRERGLLKRDAAGFWQLSGPLADRSVPETIELVLAAQIDQLDEATRELVQVAAVIGTSVPYRVLAGVYSQARQPARRLLALVQAGILVPDDQEAQRGFRFRQAMLRDVAYQGILYAQRRELHRRVAERIESVFAGQIERFATELAYHYAQAEAYAQACDYALRAGRRSRAQGGLAEALAGYNQAWTLAGQHPGALSPAEALQVQEELADIEALAGHYEAARRHYRELLARADLRAQAGSNLRLIGLCRKLGDLYEQQSLFDDALEWLHRARRLFEETARELAASQDAAAVALELSRICSTIGWVSFRRGEPERARQWLDEALGALGAGTDREEVLEERARLYNRLGGVAWMLGNLQAARVYVERSLADFSALADLPGKADAQNNLGILAEQLGDWQAAISSYQAALEANQQSGRRRAAALSRLNLGAAYLQLNDPAAALPLLTQATAETNALGDTIHEIMALRWLGRAHTRLGRYAEAQVALERSLAHAQEGQLLLEQLDTYTALGELAFARADLHAARAAYRNGQPLFGRVDQQTLEAGLFLRFAAQVEEQAGDDVHSAALRNRSQMILEKLGLPAPPER